MSQPVAPRVEALKDLGNACKAAGDLDGAARHYRSALALAPDHPASLYNLGLTLRDLGDVAEAESCFRRIVCLDASDVDALHHLGSLLHSRLQLEEAAHVYRQALAINPQDPPLWLALGEVGLARFTDRSLQESAEAFGKAVALQPALAHAHHGLGRAHRLDGRHDLALRCFEAALELAPDDASFRADALWERQSMCEWAGFRELSAGLLRVALVQPVAPFNVICIDSTPAEQLACATVFSNAVAEGVRATRQSLDFRFEPAPRQRLRIGYLSAEFHAHATASLTAELFELHDRSRFEIVAYAYGPDDASPVRARLERAFDRFVDVRLLSDGETARRIHADGVDILVDLKGYTFRSRPEIAALRPAPVQVSYIGYPGSMGASFIDYLVADRFVIPLEERPHYREALVLLPDCYQVNDRQRAIGPTAPRHALGLPDRGFVFCCFNQSYKITPEVFAVWMRLLAAVPGSVLWLLDWNSRATQNLRQAASRSGVDAARLVFGPMLPMEAHLGRMRAAELFLDTVPVNAHTTASEALWAGLPVLTCTGPSFASRVAGSLLSAAGLPQLITRSLAEYEELGLRLARAPGDLQAMRAHLARDRGALALFDTPRYVRHLEAAYKAMWRNYAAGAPPRPIEL